MGSVVADARAAVRREVKLPDGYWFDWSGEFENEQRAMARLRLIVPLCLLVILGLLYSALGNARSASRSSSRPRSR